MDALVVVDMQVACIDQVSRYQINSVAEAINQLSGQFRKANRPVIHIQHEQASGDFIRGSVGWQISPRLLVEESDKRIAKSYCDGFIHTELKALLAKLNIHELVIVGCATDFCVDSTIKGAIANGFNVVIAADGHTTSDRPHATAQQLIAHFNWNWANLIVGAQTIRVMPTAEIINTLTDN